MKAPRGAGPRWLPLSSAASVCPCARSRAAGREGTLSRSAAGRSLPPPVSGPLCSEADALLPAMLVSEFVTRGEGDRAADSALKTGKM